MHELYERKTAKLHVPPSRSHGENDKVAAVMVD